MLLFFFSHPLLRAARKKTKTGAYQVASSKPQARGKRARTHSYQIVDFKAPSCLEHRTQRNISLPAWCRSGISSARTMLLVFGREGGDSFLNLDRRDRWPLQKATTHVFHPTPTKVQRSNQLSEPRWLKHHTHHSTTPVSGVRGQHEQ